MTYTTASEKFLFEKKTIALFASIVLALTSSLVFVQPAKADTAGTVAVFYNGNTIATSASIPVSETATRLSSTDNFRVSLTLTTRTATSSRANFTFGGWSLTASGPAINQSEFRVTTSSATRIDLHAVWNTNLVFNTNGATTGTLGRSTLDTIRLGQSFTLPSSGTLARPNYTFGGWMPTTVSTIRYTTSYALDSASTGNEILYAAWMRTLSFNTNGATSGSTPNPLIYIADGAALTLPTASATAMRRTGYDFAGWSTTSTGTTPLGATYIPVFATQTLYAIWKPMTTATSTKVFFKLGKAAIRSSERAVLSGLVATLQGKTNIRVAVSATRPRSAPLSLGKARNKAVVDTLKTLGLTATYSRSNSIGTASVSSAPKNNRVTVTVRWTNPN